eukprot:scaffold23223_cov33-Tisochrysis_lutea.AAC.7
MPMSCPHRCADKHPRPRATRGGVRLTASARRAAVTFPRVWLVLPGTSELILFTRADGITSA